jgi:carbon dioxide concentrating mechanism protein CcmM
VREVIAWVKKRDQTPLLINSHCFEPFISPNPITSLNPVQRFPNIDKTAFVSKFFSVIGDVTIRNKVYVAPNVNIRADEGTPFYIGSHSNIQGGVILHGLFNKRILVGTNGYSIFIGNEVTIAHGAIVHGPCYIADKVFAGFNSIVYNATLGRGAFISYNAVVTNGIRIPLVGLFRQELILIHKKKRMHFQQYLKIVRNLHMKFNGSIMNSPHLMLFGKNRCSCRFAYDQ